MSLYPMEGVCGGQAKVSNFNVSWRAQEYVARLEVPMYYILWGENSNNVMDTWLLHYGISQITGFIQLH